MSGARMEWESSILRAADAHAHDCPICRVGERPEAASREDLLATVVLLDHKLAEEQALTRSLTHALSEVQDEAPGL